MSRIHINLFVLSVILLLFSPNFYFKIVLIDLKPLTGKQHELSQHKVRHLASMSSELHHSSEQATDDDEFLSPGGSLAGRTSEDEDTVKFGGSVRNSGRKCC